MFARTLIVGVGHDELLNLLTRSDPGTLQRIVRRPGTTRPRKSSRQKRRGQDLFLDDGGLIDAAILWKRARWEGRPPLCSIGSVCELGV
jgi:hypothetical protein